GGGRSGGNSTRAFPPAAPGGAGKPPANTAVGRINDGRSGSGGGEQRSNSKAPPVRGRFVGDSGNGTPLRNGGGGRNSSRGPGGAALFSTAAGVAAVAAAAAAGTAAASSLPKKGSG
ncbi:unnamed protein product, partial [Pylaiella littoralis]